MAEVLRVVQLYRLRISEGHMRRRGNKAEENINATALQSVLGKNEEELLWIAAVMAGSRQAGEQCLAEAIELTAAAQYVGQAWMLSWVKRLLVHVTLRRITAEIRELLPRSGARSTVTTSRAGASTIDREKIRLIPPQGIIASFDVLERTCFVLYVYLQYPVLDCALLLGCPRTWIEPVCERVWMTIAEADQTTQDGIGDLDPFISAGVTECAG